MKFKTITNALKWLGVMGVSGVIAYSLVKVANVFKNITNPLAEKGKNLIAGNDITAPIKFIEKPKDKPGTPKIIRLTEIPRIGSYLRGNLWELEGKEYTVGTDLRDRLEELRRQAEATNNRILVQVMASEDTQNADDANKIENMLESLGITYDVTYFKG